MQQASGSQRSHDHFGDLQKTVVGFRPGHVSLIGDHVIEFEIARPLRERRTV
jgi:hypothetical protein